MAELDGYDWENPPDYPWQLKLAAWSPNAGRPEAERRRSLARRMFESERESRADGVGPRPGLFWDGRAGLFRFGDGRFALSREHADWRRLKEIGCFSEWGM